MSMRASEPAAAPAVRSMDDDPIVQGVLTAISQKRLRPGAKLGEDQLAKAFGTTRVRVRQALAHLASRKIVKQFPNRGTFIDQPSWKEAQDIFATRRVIEAATVSAAIDRLDEAGIAALRAHAEREARHDHADRWASLTVTAEFHVLIAELADNAVLLEMARELFLRTSLAIATFEQAGVPDCSPEAHPAITALVVARDKPAALAAMAQHLDAIERRLRPPLDAAGSDDLAAIFREIGVAPVRKRR